MDAGISAIIVEIVMKEGLKSQVKAAYAYLGISNSEGPARALGEIDRKLREIQQTLTKVQGSLDQQRLASLWGGLSMLRDSASMKNGKQAMLERALADFHVTTFRTCL